VFIDPSFAEASSLNTLYQLVGRAGRVGRSYMAKVILIDDKIRNRIVSFNELNVEANHLEIAMDRVIKLLGDDIMDVPPEITPETKDEKDKDKKKTAPAATKAASTAAAAPNKAGRDVPDHIKAAEEAELAELAVEDAKVEEEDADADDGEVEDDWENLL